MTKKKVYEYSNNVPDAYEYSLDQLDSDKGKNIFEYESNGSGKYFQPKNRLKKYFLIFYLSMTCVLLIPDVIWLISASSLTSGGLFDDFLPEFSGFLIQFNSFSETVFITFKYVIVIVLFFLGFITLLKFRGIYRMTKVRAPNYKVIPGKGSKEVDVNKGILRKWSVFMGLIYIFLAIGILFDFLIQFVFTILKPIDPKFIFSIINATGELDPEFMERLSDISLAMYDYEKSIYYVLSYPSLLAFFYLIFGIWVYVYKGPMESKFSIKNILYYIALGLIFGFSTFMPLLIS